MITLPFFRALLVSLCAVLALYASVLAILAASGVGVTVTVVTMDAPVSWDNAVLSMLCAGGLALVVHTVRRLPFEITINNANLQATKGE